ncbi:MAG: hypothetical protein IPG43_18180 [Proteobacteria bacterium]|nr:hypothetical protein [Pseudomonadota bacterium]
MSKRGKLATGAAGTDHDGSRRRYLQAVAAAGLALGMAPRGASARAARVALFVSDTLASYGFAPPHPFSTTRQASFLAASVEQGLLAHCQPLGGARRHLR